MLKFKSFGETLLLYIIVHNFEIKLNLISSLHLFSSGQGSNYIFSQRFNNYYFGFRKIKSNQGTNKNHIMN